MLISRTPLRVSLFGGGTDFEDYYKVNGGEVVSLAIEKSIFVTVNKRFDGKLHLRYSKTEEVLGYQDLKHDIVKECLKYVGIQSGIEIVTISDVPSIGTGLGSSGALTVGLLKALYAYVGIDVDNRRLADIACEIEIDKLGAHIGKQDQYVCALGGTKHIKFNKDGSIGTIDLWEDYGKEIERLLENSLLFYIPNGRKSSKILKVYKKSIEENRKVIDLHKSLVQEFLGDLRKYQISVEKFGMMLNQAWRIKKESSPATNEIVEKAFSVAMGSGAIGGKLCGAGGGGFMLVVVYSKDKQRVIDAMDKEGFKSCNIGVSHIGSEIIYRSSV